MSLFPSCFLLPLYVKITREYYVRIIIFSENGIKIFIKQLSEDGDMDRAIMERTYINIQCLTI